MISAMHRAPRRAILRGAVLGAAGTVAGPALSGCTDTGSPATHRRPRRAGPEAGTAALAVDPELMSLTGQTLHIADLGHRYGLNVTD